jgi:hypothetical protein
MKPTERQKAIARVIQEQGIFWEKTNDINSPTHFTDIDEEVMARLEMEDLLNDDEAEELKNLLGDLCSFVKKHK